MREELKIFDQDHSAYKEASALVFNKFSEYSKDHNEHKEMLFQFCLNHIENLVLNWDIGEEAISIVIDAMEQAREDLDELQKRDNPRES